MPTSPVVGAVIFDMDGVLVNSEPLHERAFRETLAELGYPDGAGLNFQDYVGRSDHELWEDFARIHRPPVPVAALMARKRERLLRLLASEQPWYPGALWLVRTLHGRWPLGLASGSERPVIDAVLEGTGLRSCFQAILSGAEVPRGKPAPDIFLRTARFLGVAPERCWVIEDSLPGIAAARAAGMFVIAVPNTHPPDALRNAHHVAADYFAIARLLGVEPDEVQGA